jgi:phosphoribosylamine-glycine ligase
MKRVILGLVLLLVAASFVFAQEAAVLTLKGVIIDTQCAGTQTPEQLAEFVKTHTKECALAPSCAASGYNIFADGKLSKFDKESSAKVEEFLKKEDSKLQAVVEAKQVGNELSLVSIKNQD